MPPKTARSVRFLASAAVAVVLALSVAGCKTTGDDTTGSIGASDTPRSEREWRRSLDRWGARYRENPGDVEAAMAYARALRATEQNAQAVAVLEQSTMRNPNNMPLLGDYGRALAAAGDYAKALDALGRAHTPDNPDWRILNAQGAVLDQMGRHAEAQRHYSAALKIVPDEPSVLSNLGLSYTLMKDLKRAETTLRRALAQPKSDPKVHGRTSRWSSACRAGFRKPRRSPAPICPKPKLPPMSAICVRCCRSRKIGRNRADGSICRRPTRAPKRYRYALKGPAGA